MGFVHPKDISNISIRRSRLVLGNCLFKTLSVSYLHHAAGLGSSCEVFVSRQISPPKIQFSRKALCTKFILLEVSTSSLHSFERKKFGGNCIRDRSAQLRLSCGVGTYRRDFGLNITRKPPIAILSLIIGSWLEFHLYLMPSDIALARWFMSAPMVSYQM